MTKEPPPPVIDSARVIAYAFVDDLTYQKWGALYVGDKLVEHVPRLAICVSLDNEMGPRLFHCDEHWSVLGTSGADTVQAVKGRAEKNYPGVKERWIDTNVSEDQALQYYDAEFGGLKCSFCGRRPFQVDAWVAGNNAIICNMCVNDFHQSLGKSEARDGGPA